MRPLPRLRGPVTIAAVLVCLLFASPAAARVGSFSGAGLSAFSGGSASGAGNIGMPMRLWRRIRGLPIDRRSQVYEWLIPTSKLSYDTSKALDTVLLAATTPWTVPSTSLLIPIGFGAAWGDVYAGVGVVNRSRYITKPDGAMSVGFGLFDPERYVGLEVNLTNLDLGSVPFTTSGAIGLKVHRDLPWTMAIAVGVEYLAYYGPNDTGKYHYAVLSKVFPFADETRPFSALFLHAGVGDGVFQSEVDFYLGHKRFNFFGGAAIRVLRPLTLIASWSGTDLNVGFSIAPFRRFRMVFTPTIQDVTGNAGDGLRFGISISFADSVFSDTFPIKF